MKQRLPRKLIHSILVFLIVAGISFARFCFDDGQLLPKTSVATAVLFNNGERYFWKSTGEIVVARLRSGEDLSFGLYSRRTGALDIDPRLTDLIRTAHCSFDLDLMCVSQGGQFISWPVPWPAEGGIGIADAGRRVHYIGKRDEPSCYCISKDGANVVQYTVDPFAKGVNQVIIKPMKDGWSDKCAFEVTVPPFFTVRRVCSVNCVVADDWFDEHDICTPVKRDRFLRIALAGKLAQPNVLHIAVCKMGGNHYTLHKITFPGNVQISGVAYSPSGNAVALLLKYERVPLMVKLFGHFLNIRGIRSETVEEILTSHLDGTNMRSFGQVAYSLQNSTKLRYNNAEIQQLQWAPDGTEIGFVYRNKLHFLSVR